MNLCECGCGTEVKKQFARGHHWRKQHVDVAPAVEQHSAPPVVQVVSPTLTVATTDGPQTPPPHPLPFDHGRFRIAEEQPGTDLTQPWRLTYCLECREPTWSHDNTSKTKDEKLCESCAYMLLTELTEMRVQKENRTQRGNYDPFQ